MTPRACYHNINEQFIGQEREDYHKQAISEAGLEPPTASQDVSGNIAIKLTHRHTKWTCIHLLDVLLPWDQGDSALGRDDTIRKH